MDKEKIINNLRKYFPTEHFTKKFEIKLDKNMKPTGEIGTTVILYNNEINIKTNTNGDIIEIYPYVPMSVAKEYGISEENLIGQPYISISTIGKEDDFYYTTRDERLLLVSKSGKKREYFYYTEESTENPALVNLLLRSNDYVYTYGSISSPFMIEGFGIEYIEDMEIPDFPVSIDEEDVKKAIEKSKSLLAEL